MIGATNELIKQNYVRHEKQIQRMEKEIKKKDGTNLIMQQVLIKLLKECWNIVDVRNHKFDEMLSILVRLFDHLIALAPTTEAFDTLTLQINTSFEKVFDKFSDLKESIFLAPVSRSSAARGGEGPSS